MQVFLPNSFRIKHFERKKRVRDWKGYGIVQQCGTCEPLQSPTDVALEMSGSAELCRERPNKNSRTKYYDARHRKEIEAHSHAKELDARHPEEPATGLKKMED